MRTKKIFLWLGTIILLILLISLFIKIPTESGPNYNTTSSLLGFLIFYNPIILFIYIAIALLLIYKSLNKKLKFV